MSDNIQEIKTDEDKISRFRFGLGTAIVVVVMILISVFIYVRFIADRKYNTYEVIKSVTRDDDGNTKYVPYDKDKVIKYSRDGITAIGGDGNTVWSASYEMKNPMVVTCGESVAVADIGNQSLIIYDGKGNEDVVEILKPIENVAVCSQGIAAVVVKDEECNYIYICDGDTVYTEIKTRIKEDGYPVSIAYSPDGKKLVTGYVQVADESIKSMLTFYNFSEVGKEYDSDIVKAEDFGESIIPRIAFVNDSNVAVFASNKAMVYEMKEIPKMIFETDDFSDSIKSVAWDSKYISLITEDETQGKKELKVYALNGKQTGKHEVTINYKDMVMSGEDVILYNDSQIQVITKNGNEKIFLEENSQVSYVMPYSGDDKYYLVNTDNINLIKLKRGK